MTIDPIVLDAKPPKKQVISGIEFSVGGLAVTLKQLDGSKADINEAYQRVLNALTPQMVAMKKVKPSYYSGPIDDGQ